MAIVPCKSYAHVSVSATETIHKNRSCPSYRGTWLAKTKINRSKVDSEASSKHNQAFSIERGITPANKFFTEKRANNPEFSMKRIRPDANPNVISPRRPSNVRSEFDPFKTPPRANEKDCLSPPLLKRRLDRDFLTSDTFDVLALPLLPSEKISIAERNRELNWENIEEPFESLKLRPRLLGDLQYLSKHDNGGQSLPSVMIAAADYLRTAPVAEEEASTVDSKTMSFDPTAATRSLPSFFRKRRNGSDSASLLGNIVDETCCAWSNDLGWKDISAAFDPVNSPI